MRRRPQLRAWALTASLALAACAPPPEDEGPFTFDLGGCGRTCGDGPVYLIDSFEFIVEEEVGLDGFDLDGTEADCDRDDGVAPDGRAGIDNQVGVVWPLFPAAVTDVLAGAIQGSIGSGYLLPVLEIVGPETLDEDGPAAFVIRQGEGDVLIGTDLRPLPGQTLDLAADDNLLGTSDSAAVEDGRLQATDVSMVFRIEYLDTEVEIVVVGGRAEMTADGSGGIDLLLGGVVPVDALTAIVGRLGGCGDERIRQTLETLVPLLIDSRTDPGGACDGVSGAFRAHAVPVFLYDEDA